MISKVVHLLEGSLAIFGVFYVQFVDESKDQGSLLTEMYTKINSEGRTGCGAPILQDSPPLLSFPRWPQ
jgi:hypothetical protein